MSRLCTCDLCEAQIDFAGPGSPDNWCTVKLDVRVTRNIGAVAWKFDLCDKCHKSTMKLRDKGAAKEFLKFLSKADV